MSDPTPTLTAPAARPLELTKYTYDGPVSGATIAFGTTPEGEPDVRDVQLHPGAKVELPADDDHVKALIELGYLEPAAPETKADKKAEARGDAKTEIKKGGDK